MIHGNLLTIELLQPRPFRGDIGDRFYLAEEAVNVSQSCLMVFRRIGGRSIGYKNNVVIPDESLTRGRFHANIGGNTCQNNRTDSVRTQN